jgi:hypothetical protein
VEQQHDVFYTCLEVSLFYANAVMKKEEVYLIMVTALLVLLASFFVHKLCLGSSKHVYGSCNSYFLSYFTC